MISAQVYGKGTTYYSAKAILNFWKKHGINTQGIFIEDGSGLSRYNAWSTEQICQILQFIEKTDTDEKTDKKFQHTLPLLGKEGTVKNVCKSQPAAGRIRTKSGFIKRARSYAGYGKTFTQKPFAFAITINNYSGSYKATTKRFEKIFNALVYLDIESFQH